MERRILICDHCGKEDIEDGTYISTEQGIMKLSHSDTLTFTKDHFCSMECLTCALHIPENWESSDL
jgi:hypothetical protein